MTKDELVKLGLDEELADKVLEKYKNMIPYERFSEMTNKKNTLDADLKELQKKYTELETNFNTYKSSNNTDELNIKIAELEKQNKSDNLNNLIELELVRSGAKNTKAVKSLLNIDKIIEDNENLKTQIKELQEKESYLFGKDTIIGGAEPKNTPNIENNTPVNLGGAISNYYKKGE